METGDRLFVHIVWHDARPQRARCYAQILDRGDIQMPVRSCHHRHKTTEAALRCGERMLRALTCLCVIPRSADMMATDHTHAIRIGGSGERR